MLGRRVFVPISSQIHTEHFCRHLHTTRGNTSVCRSVQGRYPSIYKLHKTLVDVKAVRHRRSEERWFSIGASEEYGEADVEKKAARRKGRVGGKARKGEGEGKLTPMLRQYWQAKKAYPDCVLLFRMGDFFEVFYEDAKVVSSVLRIALTRRTRKSGEDEGAIPMCGSKLEGMA